MEKYKWFGRILRGNGVYFLKDELLFMRAPVYGSTQFMTHSVNSSSVCASRHAKQEFTVPISSRAKRLVGMSVRVLG